jgi:mannose-6-phosphate isomerase-like protein (cupin superfamily)
MSYAASPRPTFDAPTAIPYDRVTRHLWGDDAAGRVDDWIYVSSGKIHQLVFGLPSGQGFRHSESYRTVFGADEVLYVLQGTLVCANPETGEVKRAETGEAIFFRKDTWHHGFSAGTEPLRVLEFFAPPPSTGSSGAYAKTRPYVADFRYDGGEVLGRWPMDRAGVTAADRMTLMGDRDLRWRMEGADQALLIGLYCATEHLTVGKAQLLPGRRSGVVRRGGDTSLYVTAGHLNLHCPEHDGPRWLDAGVRDGAYVPAGVPHEFWNMTDSPVEFLFGVAPDYPG